MAKTVAVNENKRRFELLKKEKEWVFGMMSKPFRCKKCGAPVDPENMQTCWNCDEKQAVDVSKEAK